MSREESAIPAITVNSWLQLTEEVYRDSWDAQINRFRSPFVFRGEGGGTHDLSTGLMRLGGGYEDLHRLEAHMLRNFKKYAHSDAAAGDSVWNWLALAQHHGLPTRLLDWTYSPFVAMHFATDDLNLYQEDGVIWCVNHREANKFLPKSLRKEAENEGSNVFTVEMLTRVATTLEQFDKLSRDDFVVYLEPPSLDARIVNQFALFSLMSTPSKSLDQWLISHPELGRKIIIPAALKWEVRDKLDQSNITERMLFPGMDGLCRWLSRYYTLGRGTR